jgi:hypothetical protein
VVSDEETCPNPANSVEPTTWIGSIALKFHGRRENRKNGAIFGKSMLDLLTMDGVCNLWSVIRTLGIYLGLKRLP